MNYIGYPERAYGSFLFSTEKKVHHLQELALCTLVVMNTGKVFVHAAENLVIDTQEPVLAHLWFEHILYTTEPPSEQLLLSNDTAIHKKLQDIKEKYQPQYPLVGVAYDERMESFFEAFHPEWSKLPLTEDAINGYVLQYQLARTKNEKTEEPELFFSDPTHAYTINTNELLQIAVGMALTIKKNDFVFPTQIESVEFNIKPHKKQRQDISLRHLHKKEKDTQSLSIYCLIS